MAQSSTLFLGMDVHKEAIAVALWRRILAPRCPLSGLLASASVPSINSSVKCTQRPNTSCSSLRPVPVATGSIGP
jgi:hypothetical protein